MLVIYMFTCKYPTFLEKVTLKAEVCIIIYTDQISHMNLRCNTSLLQLLCKARQSMNAEFRVQKTKTFRHLPAKVALRIWLLVTPNSLLNKVFQKRSAQCC